MRVGIITLYHGNYNYGGLLQAYALQRVIGENCFCEIIDCNFRKQKELWDRFLFLGTRESFRILLMKLQMKYHTSTNKRFRQGMRQREQAFDLFSQSIPHSTSYTLETISGAADSYDIYVVGSDQVWNPGLWNNALFLSFVKKAKKVAYAASLGVSELSFREKEHMKKMLADFSAISMREPQASKVISELAQQKVETVLDPTLLLGEAFWRNVAVRAPISDPYVFVYMVQENELSRQIIYRFCKHYGYRMVAIPHTQGRYKTIDEKYSDINLYGIGPREWLGLIAGAEFVCVDSFHGTAFALNMGKNFWSFEKSAKNNQEGDSLRIEALLRQFDLLNRKIAYGQNIDIAFLKKAVDYSRFSKMLDVKRQLSLQYIQKMLEGEQDAAI